MGYHEPASLKHVNVFEREFLNMPGHILKHVNVFERVLEKMFDRIHTRLTR